MSKWNTIKIMAITGVAALYIVLAILFTVIQSTTGIIGSGSVIMIPLAAMLIIFCCLLIQKFGTATLFEIIYGIGALPLATSGPPGFLPKVAIAVSGGIVIDITFTLLKKNKLAASMVAGALGEAVISFGVVGVGILFSIPGMEFARKILFSPLAIFVFILGGFGGYLGYLTYNKLKNTAIVRRIQA